MDIPNATNKVVVSSAAVNKTADTPTTIKAVSGMMNEYFFPGGGVWKEMRITALTREDAEAAHRMKREPVSPAKVEVQTVSK